MKYFLGLIIFFSLQQSQDRILCIGDSITEDGRYVEILKDSFDCSRMGFAGKSSTYIMERLFNTNLKTYDILVIEAGVNNIYNPNQVFEDLELMAEYGKSKGLKVVMLTLVPVKGYSKFTDENLENHRKINQWIKSKPPNVDVVVDVYALLANKDGTSKYATDKLHPNKIGHQIMGRAILKELIKKGA
jgi:lysophospholipase L1-like esterase